MLFAAAMGAGYASDLDRALAQMQTSQHDILEQLLNLQEQHPCCIHACTDITGFGCYYLNEMVAASNPVTIEPGSTRSPFSQVPQHCSMRASPAPWPPPTADLASLSNQIRAIKAGRDQSNSLNPAQKRC